jgi:hypothetical protein
VFHNEYVDTDIIVEYMLIAEYVPVSPTDFFDMRLTPPPSRYDIRYPDKWMPVNTKLAKINGRRLINVIKPSIVGPPTMVDI